MTEDTIRDMKDALMEVRKSKECLSKILNTYPNQIPLVIRGWIVHLYAETEEVEDGIVKTIRDWQDHFDDREEEVEE